MTIRPFGGMILIRPEKPKELEGLIHIPQSLQKVPCRGEVLAVGPGRVEEDGVFRETKLRPGERVLYERLGVHEVPGEPELRLVSAAYVLGTVDP